MTTYIGHTSGKSAATGKPHFFTEESVYPEQPVTGRCAWCGNAREHEWHVEGLTRG